MKRRGKIRKKKKKSHQTPDKGEKEVTDLIEPNETLVTTQIYCISYALVRICEKITRLESA